MTDDVGQPFLEKKQNWLVKRMTTAKLRKGNVPALAAKSLRKSYLCRKPIKVLEEIFDKYGCDRVDMLETEEQDFYAESVEKMMRKDYNNPPCI